ncbi:hypothetical protein FGB62_2g121 [Gracilaria domingensis]|nr:hypothetical protein FGB62_2g121 [Gracilaria domingensis]
MEASNSNPERDQSEEDSDQSMEPSAQQQPQEQEQQEEEQDDVVVVEDGETEEEEVASYAEYEALFEENDKPLWDTIDVSKALQPLTEEEKQRLRAKLPKRLANFLIRRADAAVRLRNTKPGDSTFIGSFLKDLPPDRVAWDDPANEEFRDYVYETTTGPPSYRRQGSSLFGGGDGLPEMEDLPDVEEPVETSSGLRFPKKLMSMLGTLYWLSSCFSSQQRSYLLLFLSSYRSPSRSFRSLR